MLISNIAMVLKFNDDVMVTRVQKINASRDIYPITDVLTSPYISDHEINEIEKLA